MKPYWLTIVALAALAALLPVTTWAGHDTNHVGLLGAAWNHTNITVRVNIGQGVDPAVSDAVFAAIDDWNAAIDSIDTTFDDFDLTVVSSGQADITIVLRKGGNPLTAVGGTTFPLVRGDGSFFKAKIEVIGQLLGFPFSAVLVGNIVRHELAHALGLDHSDFSDSTMDDDGDNVVEAGEFTGDLMQTTVPDDGDDFEIPISACDKAAFATVHEWYPDSDPLGALADFAPPAASEEGC